jgi:disulfide bond formation protein DsbB
MQDIFLKLISLGALILICASLLYTILNISKISNPLRPFISKYRMHLLFIVSLGGTVGSLLLSVYFKLAPCELCWYQRVFLFSSPIITGVALSRKDMQASAYIFWLSILGSLVAIYHSLLQFNLFQSDSVFCSPTSVIDCAVPAFTYFGFVTIPVISFSVFLLLLIISYDYKKI